MPPNSLAFSSVAIIRLEANDMEDYTGLAAIAWDLFSGDEPGPDHAFFQSVIAHHPGPALDVGCGTGRLLVPYLSAGLEVEGVDPSVDMLVICRKRAQERGLTPILYQQAMQKLNLPHAYRTIFVPCGSFQLVVERAEAFEALRRFYAHLESDSLLVLTAFNRWLEMADEQLGAWKHRATRSLPDGS
jgi:SAM-dependent methyltransferase